MSKRQFMPYLEPVRYFRYLSYQEELRYDKYEEISILETAHRKPIQEQTNSATLL